ncbi:RNA polymerase sigma factor [Aequorivita antarctica]|uniref:Sigma-70 family RNA polymerase sigma factor n=1 Tax=Aequorivita antarctica TaxID=153266 RepID=A0A5C6YWB6_9FLAO|nr:sigma-70 family RNA polymerase sigma factor [Aequorivita antarctica]TXD71377.1 sigma-70 family RNA polymerase sigma factor [Aequorivita antarctica]
MGNENSLSSDKVIVAKILNGNTQDFAVIVKSTEKLVTQIVRKMTVNQDDQNDLVQDIYLKVYQNLSSFQYKSKLSTWIANIAYNTTINYLQKKKIPILDIETTLESKSTLSENIEMEIFKKESLEILNIELNKLPPLYNTLLTLYHLEELSNREISEITKLPEGTIKSYLYRARKILKDNINHHFKIYVHEK